MNNEAETVNNTPESIECWWEGTDICIKTDDGKIARLKDGSVKITRVNESGETEVLYDSEADVDRLDEVNQ